MPSNLPAAALVRLYRDKDGLLVDATHSDPATGAYSFTLLDMTYTYTALAYDTSTAVYRAVAGDRLTPIPM